MLKASTLKAWCLTLCVIAVPVWAAAQGVQRVAAERATPPAVLPAGYVIGVEDVLQVVVWREQEISSDVVVRPDGKISLPLLNDIHAAGLSPEALAAVVEKAAVRYITDPSATVIVKEIRSRKVYVIGEVGRPGTVPLVSEMNVLQVLAEVGGLLEHANRKNIVIVRRENGVDRRFTFNYNDVLKGKKVEQNIQLLPGDTILVR